MIPGEWRVTAQSGKSIFHTWHWGPAQKSMRVMSDGHGANGDPWRALNVYYWHPGRQKIVHLGLSPFADGVSEGTIAIEGETVTGEFDLFQTGDHRKMAIRWQFDGPDKFHETLLESTGGAKYQPLAEWDHLRIAAQPRVPERDSKLSEPLKIFEPLLGKTWEARGTWLQGDALHFRTKIEWIPLAKVLYFRVTAPSEGGDPVHLVDAYLFHHTGSKSLRTLVLTNQGGIYEGQVTIIEGGSLKFDLRGYEGENIIPYVAEIDFNKDGSVRSRVWSRRDTEQKLQYDVHHQAIR